MILAHDLNGLSKGTTYSASNAYNPEGLRIMKDLTQNGVTDTTNYLYEYGHVVLETDDAGNETGYNIYANDTLMSRKSGGTVLYYLYNGHEDVTALTDVLPKELLFILAPETI